MKTKLLLITLTSMLVCSLSSAATAKDAWNSLITEKAQKQAAYAFVENDPALPNVLIYGDSISIAYTPRVREQLKGKANVYRLYTNGGDSGSFIQKMTQMHDTMQDKSVKGRWDFKWDVIQFNVGLHDLKYVVENKLDKVNGKQVNSTQTYRKNLEAIIAYLKKLAPNAQLIFATTTPVPDGEAGRHAGDAARYNKVALRVLKKNPEIIVNDLFKFTKPNHEVWWTKPGNVHYNDEGKNAQGDEVARVILKALK